MGVIFDDPVDLYLILFRESFTTKLINIHNSDQLNFFISFSCKIVTTHPLYTGN